MPTPTTTPTASSRHIVVIGAGLAGLAAACELQTHGFEVTLIEKNDHLGGKMNVLIADTRAGRFNFDMGPTIITIPDVLRGILRRAGRTPADEIDLVNLDPQWRCFFDDGTVLNLRQKPETMAAELDHQFPGKAVGSSYLGFINYSRRMLRLSEKVFFYKDLGGMTDLMREKPPTDPGLLRDVMAMRLHSTVGATLHKMITEPHVRQMCEHFLQYVGSSPFLAPTILTLIAAAQTDHGCWYPMGGTREVARSLERLLRERGANVITGVKVARILESGGRASGVELEGGKVIHADAVVSNCDVQRSLAGLVGGSAGSSAQRRVAASYKPACSGLVLYLALDRQYDHLAHHCFLFSRDSHAEFDDIYNKSIPARDPSIYLAVPSRTDPAQAPPGCEAFYALIHTPANPASAPRWGSRGEGKLLDQYRPVVIDKLKRCGMPDLEDRILVETHLTPDMIDTMYNAEGGAIYGLASHGKLIGGFKPRNRSGVMKGLYLAGGSVNPGPGVPMVLMSGVTAARCVAQDFGVEPMAIDATPPVTTRVPKRELAGV
ncbi:MAG: phytoene desaturase family protein [Phycisphaerales bacterium]